MLKVMTWFWPGFYAARMVNAWADMVSQNLAMPHTLACVTDHPEGIDESIEIIRTPRDFVSFKPRFPRVPYTECYRRLALYSPQADRYFGADRFVSMDMDVLVFGRLDPLFDHDRPFTVSAGGAADGAYGGSMVQMNAGARPEVYTEFTSERAEEAARIRAGSDRSWLNYILPAGEHTWGRDDGVKHFLQEATVNGRRDPPDDCRLLFFSGTIKPWNMKGWPRQKWELHDGALG